MFKRMFPWLYDQMTKPIREYQCSSCDEIYSYLGPGGRSHKCDQYLVTKKAVREVLEEMGFKK